MALKDWKKTQNKKDWIQYNKKNDMYWNSDYVSIEPFKDNWTVSTILFEGDNEKSFKSKSQALKFAKSYMRKN